jgi:hypothetical protein
MANINASQQEATFQIKRWLGLNENPDGDISLKMGEAAEMRNFRITKEGHLQKRPGYKTVADLGAGCKGLWNGNVGGTEYTLAAAGGKVYKLDVSAGTKTELGSVAADVRVFFFPYGGKVYILDGSEYRSWDGTTYAVVSGYVPCVYTATPPAGGGTAYEPVNKLTAKKSQQFSADGTSTVYQLAETGIASVDKVTVNGAETTAYTADLATGKVTFTAAPATGINNVQIWWTGSANDRAKITGMRFAEQYNGTTDNRVFLYGDGSNEAVYSGIDVNGKPTAEYFPDLNVMAVGDSNTPITGMCRQFSRLIVFKATSTFSIAYAPITLTDGTVTAGFYVTPANRNIGNEAPGQIRLITNYPFSLHGGGVYQWKNGSNGLTSDERQAKRISQRVENTLSGFTFSDCITFENEYKQDYYIVWGDRAVIYNYTSDTWFVYSAFPATAFVMVGNEMYIGTASGKFCHVSRNYKSDDGAAIDCYWRSGSIDFQREWQRKFSTTIWVSIKPESNARVTVTAQSDRKSGYLETVVASSLATFTAANFAHWSFSTNRRAQVIRVRLKVKKFALYQLIFQDVSNDATCTILSTDFRVAYTGNVK